jgi:hypothetical protein
MLANRIPTVKIMTNEFPCFDDVHLDDIVPSGETLGPSVFSFVLDCGQLGLARFASFVSLLGLIALAVTNESKQSI